MTLIRIKDLDDGFEIMMEGHAGDAPHGQNVLCACLSTYVMIAMHLLEILQDREGVSYGQVEVWPGFARIEVRNKGRGYDHLKLFRDAFLMAMEGAVEEYPEAIRVSTIAF